MGKTDIQKLEEEMRRINDRLSTEISKLEERMQEIVKINQMLVDTINEEDDEIEKLQIKVGKIERIFAKHIKAHQASEEKDNDVVKVKKDFDKIIRFDDVEKLQKDVEYLRGVIDGAPGEGHIKSIINGLDNRLEKVEKKVDL